MDTKPYFNNIRSVILENLKKADREIYIAMAWFTNHEIFKVVLKKALQIPVHVVVINDDINNRPGGVNFQSFIDASGKFYFGRKEKPMHNKFCIIDSSLLITGSYNYTYYAEKINYENIVLIKNSPEIIKAYKAEFQNITSDLESVTSISEYLLVHPYQRDTFSYKNYGIWDAYQHVYELKNLGLKEEARALLAEIEQEYIINDGDDFIIKNVFYRKWKQDYYIDKITVKDKMLTLHFRTVCEKGKCYINGPKTKYFWVLRNSGDKNFFLSPESITNVIVDNSLIVDSISEGEIFYLSKEGVIDVTINQLDYILNDKGFTVNEAGEPVHVVPKKILTKNFEMSCEIHFNISDFPLETVDLIEGIGTEYEDNHWHCFDINLKMNREKL